jgi:hypothetical protein
MTCGTCREVRAYYPLSLLLLPLLLLLLLLLRLSG